MPNQKISELTAIVTVDNSVDVLPIVDISANTTKKVTPNALKTALALDNVNNTSDANKPVSIAQQDALNAKVDENAPITAGTAPKITFDAKGLVTSGDSLDETDLPTGINANKIGTGAVSSTEFGYLDGVTSAIQTQINSKQATLVSGTNIKTINSTSLLGSGDIAISATPSGVSGAIQFSNGSAFASDAANLFWDDTNNRLGVGTNAPSATGHIKGSGSTSATTSLLVQNSAGRTALKVADNGVVTIGADDKSGEQLAFVGLYGTRLRILTNSSVDGITGSVINSALDFTSNDLILSSKAASTTSNVYVIPTSFTSLSGSVLVNTTTDVASSVLTVNSTTKGVLFPRMTTTQKTNISSPAEGLVVYDTTLGKLCVRTASAWETITSV
jgi:hypothetical protein